MSQGIYTRQSTDNPTGFRPWGYKLSGLGCKQCGCSSGLGRPRTTMMPIRQHRFSGLGTTTTTPDVGALQAQANNLAQQLMAMNNDMLNVQATIQAVNAAAVASGNLNPVTLDEAALLMQQRNDYENIVAQFTTAYRALFGSAPPGLSALGIDPVTLGIIAAAFVTVAGLIAVWWEHESALKISAQAKLQQQQNIAAAIAAGDTQTASILASQTSPPTDFTTWLSQNWMYVALAVGGVIVLQKL